MSKYIPIGKALPANAEVIQEVKPKYVGVSRIGVNRLCSSPFGVIRRETPKELLAILGHGTKVIKTKMVKIKQPHQKHGVWIDVQVPE